MVVDLFGDITPLYSSLYTLFTSIVFVVLARWLWIAFRTPGPWGVPIMGYYPFLRKDFYKQLHELSKKHGEAYLINIAGQNFLYLGTIKALREAHVNKVEDFSIRSNKFSVMQYPLENGIAFQSGEGWRVQRKFIVQSMREIGLAAHKEELKGPLVEAIQSTLEEFDKSKGKPLDMNAIMSRKCTDVVTKIILGNDVSDDIVAKLNDTYSQLIFPLIGINMLYLGKIAKYYVIPRLEGYAQMVKSKTEMLSMLKQILEDHKATFDINQQPRDFIDLYLREKRLKEKEGDPQAKYFTDASLLPSLIQIYGDGSFSIGLLVSLLFLLLSQQRDVQDSIHEEIVEVVGTERLPNWEDRQKLPLTNSAIKELLRVTDFFTVFPDMESVRDTTVLGVRVPKGTVTMMNIWAIHHDPNNYENPETFDMTRFMPGKKVEPPISFGIGRRACAGESLVTMELFLFIASTMQSFLVSLENDDGKPVSANMILDTKLKVTPRPKGRYGSAAS